MSGDLRVQAAIRADATSARAVERIGPFVATFDASHGNPFLNYAIPDAGAEPTPADIEGLVEAYRKRERKPRLEYLPSLAPAVEPLLLGHGFVEEMRTPLMVFAGGEEPAPPEGIELVEARSPDEIRAAGVAQNEAYGEAEPPSDAWVESAVKAIESGALRVLARDAASGEPAGGGGCAAPYEGACELYGIGVRVEYRRRGIAGALAARLAKTASDRGVTTVFLMAHGESEARIYKRVGFERIGEVLHISLPKTGDSPP